MTRRPGPRAGQTTGLRARRHRGAGPDERGSIILVLLIMITGSILVLAVAGIAVSQQVVAQRTLWRNDALQASEAGLDAAVGEIRAATNGSTGLVQDLPCTGTPANGFSVTGYLGTTSSASYTATVVYYQNIEPTAANIAAGKTEPISCFTGSTSSFPDEVPNYALVTSVGTAATTGAVTAPSRTIEEIYAFHNTNQNIPGGLIEDFNYANDDLCLADTATTPASGDSLYVEKCQTSGTADFTWLYNSNFTIELSESESSGSGLCIQGNSTNDTVQLATCLSSSSANFYTQRWGINDSGEYQTVTSSGSPGSLCINEVTNTSGSLMNLAGCSGSFSDSQTWAPTPAVGPGDAGIATDQFVNYDEFGNCLDVTNQNTSSAYMIDYMCKQFPDGAAWTPQSGKDPYDPDWNQRWEQISETYAGGGSYVELETHDLPNSDPNDYYCLYSPGSSNVGASETHDESNNPNWVVVKQCPSLVNGKVPAGDQNYLWSVNSTSTYEVQDYWGDCMKADTYDQQQPGGGSYFSTITVASCDGDSAEEWNAPPSLSDAGVSNLFEPNVSGN